MPQSLKDAFGLRLIIGREDASFLLDSNATFANVDPGGFESASFAIPKDMPDTLRGTYVRLDSGLGVAFEGRVSQIQRSLGSKTAIQCEGYGALFKDQAASCVFVDRDLTRWIAPSYTRQNALVSANYQLQSSQVAADPTSSTPALVQSVVDSWASPNMPICEAWYDSGPENLLAKIYYTWSQQNANDGGVGWRDIVNLSSNADASGTLEGTANLNSAGPVSGYFSPATALRFAFLQHYYSVTPAGSMGSTYRAYWHSLAAYGNHGLTGRGSDPVGFYPSDIFGWILNQIPGLQAGVIPQTDATGYIIPHSAYYLPVTLDQMVGDMSIISGWHWGVWESLSPLTGNATPRADFRPRPQPGAWTAYCYRKDCDTLDITEDLSQQFDKCVVTFTDVAGVDGAATVTIDNPILDQAGIPSRTLVLNGGTMDQASAALFAAEALALTNSQARVSGSADVIAAINGGTRPAWMLKAGIDRLRIMDVPSVDAFGSLSDFPIKRVECSLSPEGWKTSVELGLGASLVESLQARLAAATALSANGGV